MTGQSNMTGSVPANFHEGSRSEYLAQYVLASFGTAVPVPHQEDSGIDVYCTLLERIGKRAWPRAYYSVQVKSEMSPWEFSSPVSVRWFIEHPLPIFLCIVRKSEARIIVYATSPRFVVWSRPALPTQLVLTPGTDTQAQTVDWEAGDRHELKAPILNFTIQEIQDEGFRSHVAQVLTTWIDNDVENLGRIHSGIHSFSLPARYRTNEIMSRARIGPGMGLQERSLSQALDRLQELLVHAASHYHYREKDILTTGIFLMALRRLSAIHSGPFDLHDSSLHLEFNKLSGMDPLSDCEACDSLLKSVEDRLARIAPQSSGKQPPVDTK